MRHLKRQLLSASSAVRGFPETQHGTSKNMLLSNSQIMLQDLPVFFGFIFLFFLFETSSSALGVARWQNAVEELAGS